MGKKKLQRFQELKSFRRVVEPSFEEAFRGNYPLKGLWAEKIFQNQNPIVLELGCGRGEYTVGLARRFPGTNFIGVDIKGARMWKGAKTANEENITNAAFLRTRIEFITSFFAKGEVSGIWITFPDPQEKTRRKKKRLTSAGFLNLYRQFMVPGGEIRLKTDNLLLYQFTRELALYNSLEIPEESPDLYSDYAAGPLVEIQTHYEKQYRDKDIAIKYLNFKLPVDKEVMELPDDEE